MAKLPDIFLRLTVFLVELSSEGTFMQRARRYPSLTRVRGAFLLVFDFKQLQQLPQPYDELTGNDTQDEYSSRNGVCFEHKFD